MERERAIPDNYRQVMQATADALADILKPAAFALLVFDASSDDPRANYISNAPRPDMLAAMREFIARNENAPPRVIEDDMRELLDVIAPLVNVSREAIDEIPDGDGRREYVRALVKTWDTLRLRYPEPKSGG